MGGGWSQTSPHSWPLMEGHLRTKDKGCLSPRSHSRGPALLILCFNGFTGLFSLPSLFQIIRKVVRQIDSSGADDTQEHEEVIAEGPLEDPSEMEADIDYFMTHAKVLRRLQPPRGSRPSERLSPLPTAHLCTRPLWAPVCTMLTSSGLPCASVLHGRQGFHGCRKCCRSHVYFLPVSLCDLSCVLSLLLSPGGAERE